MVVLFRWLYKIRPVLVPPEVDRHVVGVPTIRYHSQTVPMGLTFNALLILGRTLMIL